MYMSADILSEAIIFYYSARKIWEPNGFHPGPFDLDYQ